MLVPGTKVGVRQRGEVCGMMLARKRSEVVKLTRSAEAQPY
jgi:hypothetical protein